MTRKADPATLMNQATYTAEIYLTEGARQIAKCFGVQVNSKEHKDLCMCILPEYMRTCAQDFDTAMREVRLS